MGSNSGTFAGNVEGPDNLLNGLNTITFDGSSASTSTLIGNTSFYNLVTSSKRLEFSQGATTYVTNSLTWTNTTLRSTTDGATWYLQVSSAASMPGSMQPRRRLKPTPPFPGGVEPDLAGKFSDLSLHTISSMLRASPRRMEN
jgi:hypothetical protein